MSEKTFTYEDPKFLNKLAMCISGERCELSATLHPDIPEFVEEATRQGKSKPYGMHLLSLAGLCEQHSIIPFGSLVFKEDYPPQIEYRYVRTDDDSLERFMMGCRHPGYFAMKRKWFSVIFEDIARADRVRAAQSAIFAFTRNGYVVTRLSANLDPETIKGDYVDYCTAEARLFAEKGIVTVSGNIPDDFDIKDLMQKELPAATLPLCGLEGRV
jgi:hypothetical protein